MKIARFRPTLNLASYIHEYVIVDVPGSLVVEKCLPDGFMKLFIFTGENKPQYLDEKGILKSWGDGFGGHPIHEKIYFRTPERIEGVICFFKPQGLYHLYNVPVKHFNNTILSIDILAGYEGILLKEQLAEAKTDQEKVLVLNYYFSRLVNVVGNSVVTPIGYAQHLILENNGIINIDKLADSISITRRSLERNFMDQVGTTPKYFARIVRFSYAIKQKHMYPNCSWQDIIYKCMYFDQSHFIKEFKHFSGVPPVVFYQKDHLLKEVCAGGELKYS